MTTEQQPKAPSDLSTEELLAHINAQNEIIIELLKAQNANPNANPNHIIDINAKLSRLDTKFDTKINNLDKKYDTKVTALDTKFDTKLNKESARLATNIDAVDNRLFMLVTGLILAMLGAGVLTFIIFTLAN